MLLFRERYAQLFGAEITAIGFVMLGVGGMKWAYMSRRGSAARRRPFRPYSVRSVPGIHLQKHTGSDAETR